MLQLWKQRRNQVWTNTLVLKQTRKNACDADCASAEIIIDTQNMLYVDPYSIFYGMSL